MAATASRAPSKSAGRATAKAARAAIAVDTALLTLAPGEDGLSLAVLEVKRDGDRGWQLPSAFARDGDDLAAAALRTLADAAGVAGAGPRQLQVFGEADRDGQGWTLSVAFVDVVRADALEARSDATRLVDADAPGRLPYAHAEIVGLAVDDLRLRYALGPDPDGFLPERFTLRELRLVHEAVAGEALQRDTFRRAMEPLLVVTGETTTGTRGRPAEIFTRA